MGCGRYMLVVGALCPGNISRIKSGRVLICDSAHSWRLYGAAPLGDKAVSTTT